MTIEIKAHLDDGSIVTDLATSPITGREIDYEFAEIARY